MKKFGKLFAILMAAILMLAAKAAFAAPFFTLIMYHL